MKSDKELFELFRKNQYGLNERPSANTWRRLERKLDNHRRSNHRLVFRRTIGMVAGLAILVVALFLLSLPARNHQLSASTAPQFWEELPVQAEPGNEVRHLVESRKRYQQDDFPSLPEKVSKNKIIPNVDYLSD